MDIFDTRGGGHNSLSRIEPDLATVQVKLNSFKLLSNPRRRRGRGSLTNPRRRRGRGSLTNPRRRGRGSVHDMTVTRGGGGKIMNFITV